jgi:hypothetical protein
MWEGQLGQLHDRFFDLESASSSAVRAATAPDGDETMLLVSKIQILLVYN